MVEKNYILKSQPFTFFNLPPASLRGEESNDKDSSLLMSEYNNNNDDPNYNNKNQDYNENNQQENNYDKKHNYVKVLVDDPFNNRDIILNVTKNQKGVYL